MPHPLMERWDEKNSKLRTDAYEADDLDGGVVRHFHLFISHDALCSQAFVLMTYMCLLFEGCHETF